MKVALSNAEFRKNLEALGLEPITGTPGELATASNPNSRAGPR
jgi:hypothetical protein